MKGKRWPDFQGILKILTMGFAIRMFFLFLGLLSINGCAILILKAAGV